MAKKPATQPVVDEIETEIIIPEVVEVLDEKQTEIIKANAIQIVSFTDATLEQIKAVYGKFVISNDADYKEAKSVKNKLVKVRTGVERKRKELNKIFTDSCNGEAARITSITSEVENHLAKQCEAHEQAEQRRIEARRALVIERLTESGFDFNGINYTCGDQVIWQTEIDGISDETLDAACAEAQTFRQNEATAAAEAARLAAPVYLHQPDMNELMTLTRGEFIEEAESLLANGVVEITKEQYDAIREQKLAAFRRPAPAAAPAAAPAPQPTPAPDPRNNAPEHSPQFMEAPQTGAIKQNHGFLGTPPPANEPHTGPFAPNLNPQPKQAIDAHEAGFDAGYECFRKQIVAAFENQNNKFTRGQWVEYFKNLTPFQKP